MPLVTRRITSLKLTAAKHRRLAEMARLCGAMRAENGERINADDGFCRSSV